MIHFKVDNKVPDKYLELLYKANTNNSKDYTLAVTDEPVILFIILDNITNQELNKMTKSFKISSVVLNSIPFLLLNYEEKLKFEFPISKWKNMDCEANSINIIIVEKNNFIIKNIRTIGLNKDLLKNLFDGIKNNNFIDYKIKNIQRKYTLEEIFNSKNSVNQKF